MAVEKYIADLLFDYECVIIPGLGGFIVNDKPAQINYDTHYFKPSYRKVMFNPFLNTNDGVLINRIAVEKNTSYKEAKIEVEEFVAHCVNRLNGGEEVVFNRVGVISKDENDKIVFEQDTKINFNPESFGLTAFVSPEVGRISDEEKLKTVFGGVKSGKKDTSNRKKPKDRKPVLVKSKARRKSYRRTYIVLLLLFMVGFVGFWSVANKDSIREYYVEYGSKIPVFYGNPGSYIANNVEIIPLKEISRSASALWLVNLINGNDKVAPSLKNEDYTFKSTGDLKEEKSVVGFHKPADEGIKDLLEVDDLTKKPEEVQAASKSDIATATPKQEITDETAVAVSNKEVKQVTSAKIRYYIIAGSFKNRNNAQKLVAQLQAKGFDAAIAGVNNAGMTRVAYAGFHNFKQALQQLPVIRQQENPSAWIMHK